MKDGLFDPVLHSGPRITILSRLVHDPMRFAQLEKSTGLTSGNLSNHLAMLVKAGYVLDSVDERKVERTRTLSITPAGDTAFRAYIKKVQAAMADLEAGLATNASPSPA